LFIYLLTTIEIVESSTRTDKLTDHFIDLFVGENSRLLQHDDLCDLRDITTSKTSSHESSVKRVETRIVGTVLDVGTASDAAAKTKLNSACRFSVRIHGTRDVLKKIVGLRSTRSNVVAGAFTRHGYFSAWVDARRDLQVSRSERLGKELANLGDRSLATNTNGQILALKVLLFSEELTAVTTRSMADVNALDGLTSTTTMGRID